MSNFNQEMTRWTSPTNQAFYALHKNAIGLYHTAAVVVQILWLIFSTRPLANMLVEYVPYLSAYAVIIAVVVLAFLHYVIHELVRYVFYNWLDDDPNTNSSFGTIASLVIMLGGLLALDVLGITSFIRDESKFTTLHTQNETQGSAAAQKRLDVFNADLAVINTAFNQELEAINTQYAAKINKVQRRRANDDDDRRKKRNEIVTLKAERDAAIGVKKTELATAQKQLVAEKNAALGNIDKRHNGTREKIETADADNESKAHSYGWIISIFCLITLLFCTYQATVLRVLSGQKPVSRYTIADATGSTTTKLADVLTDAWQRQSHRFLVAFHGLLTTGTSELDEIDGAFILRKKGQQATTSVNPGNNDLLGGNNGGGGGIKPPPMPPAPGQPMGGKSAHQFTGKRFDQYSGDDKMTIAEELAKFTGYTNRVCMSFLIGTNPYIGLEKGQSEYKVIFDIDNIIGHIKDYEKSVYGKDVTPTLMPSKLRLDPCHSLHSAHEAGHTTVYAAICTNNGIHFKGIKVYANDTEGEFMFANSNTELTADELAVIKMAGFAAECRYLSHKPLDYFNEIMTDHSTQPDIIEASKFVGIEKIQTAYLQAYSIISENGGFFQECYKALRGKGSLDMIELRKLNETYFNTPDDDKMNLFNIPVSQSVTTPTPTNENAPISTVAQSALTVAQQNTEKGISELDDTLERLRSQILKNSESHFSRGDAKNNSVAKRIFEACDKAYIALKRGGEVTPSVLNKFKEAALDRLDLCAAYNIEYDSREILFHMIEKRGGGQ